MAECADDKSVEEQHVASNLSTLEESSFSDNICLSGSIRDENSMRTKTHEKTMPNAINKNRRKKRVKVKKKSPELDGSPVSSASSGGAEERRGCASGANGRGVTCGGDSLQANVEGSKIR